MRLPRDSPWLVLRSGQRRRLISMAGNACGKSRPGRTVHTFSRHTSRQPCRSVGCGPATGSRCRADLAAACAVSSGSPSPQGRSGQDVRWSPLGRTAKLERGIVDHSGQGRGRSVPVTLLGTERGRCKIPSGSCHRTAAVRVPEPHWEAAVTAEEENVTPNLKRRSVVSTSSRKTGRSPNSARERRPVRPDNLIVPEGWHASMSGSRATWSSQRTATRTCRPTRSLRGQPGSPADSHRHRHQVRWVLPRRTRLFSTSRDPQPAWFVDAGRF